MLDDDRFSASFLSVLCGKIKLRNIKDLG